MAQRQEQEAVTSPASTPQSEPAKAKSKGGKKFLIIGCIILALLTCAIAASIATYIYLRSRKSEDTTTQDQTDEDQEEDEEDEEDEDEEDDTLKTSEVVEIDDTWSLYTNYQFGFSIKIPSDFYHYDGGCKWSTADGDHSYRPDPAYVPTAIFHDWDNKVAYISCEYYYELSGETTEGSKSYYSNCTKVLNSLEKLKDETSDYWYGWKFVVETVNNDTELEQFIEDRYGEGCELGDKTPTDQAGVYDVELGGEFGLIDAPGICNVNYNTEIKYYPAENIVVAWDTGQAYTFCDEEYTCYDDEMIESFRFE
jgi:hypothetical protein